MRRIGLALLAGTLVLLGAGRADAAGGLSVVPLTWGVIGLDSNDVTVGPDRFPVGARVCNTSGTAASRLTARLVWDTANPYLSVAGRTSWTLPSLSPGACRDAYFVVAVRRTPSAYFATRRFHVTFSATGRTSRTPTRELYVEKLVSQNRNAVVGIAGPSVMTLGKTYTVVVDATTAPQGYEQVEAFLTLPTALLRVDRVTTTATAGASPVSQPYLDACGWYSDPASPSYLSCAGTGKAGGDMRVTYRVTVVGLGSGTASTLVYDRSGSSYHYNTDYGRAPNLYRFTTVAPDLQVTKSHAGSFTQGGTGTFSLTVRNVGTGATTDPITVVDTLPAGMAFVSGSGGGFTCAAVGSLVRCTRTAALLPGASAVVRLVVRTTAAGTVVNRVAVSTPNDPNASNDRDTDTVEVAPVASVTGARRPTSTTVSAPAPVRVEGPTSGRPLAGPEVVLRGALPQTGAPIDRLAPLGALALLAGVALVLLSLVGRRSGRDDRAGERAPG